MIGDSFPARVQALRDTWRTRRRMKHLSNQRDLASRFELLQVLHEWTERSIEAIRQVYGNSLAIELTPPPDLAARRLSFTAAFEDAYRVSFELQPRDESGQHWDLAVRLTTPDAVTAAGQARGAGQWTPGRVEDLLLSLLAAFERARFDACKPPPPSARRTEICSHRDSASGGAAARR